MSARDDIVDRARRFAKQGDYPRAIREYARLLARNPLDLEAKVKTAYLHACNRDRQAAADVYLEVAHTYEAAGDLDNAIKVMTQVLRLQPRRTDAYFWQADLLQGAGRPGEARQWLEAAFRQLEELGRPGDAARALERMVELDPGNVALLIRLGEGYAGLDRRQEAVATLGRAVDVLRMAEWTDDFIRVAERLTYLDPRDTALARELAIHYLRRREPRKALHKLSRCYQQEPEDPETLNLVAEAFLDLRELDKAVTVLEGLAELHGRQGQQQRQQAALQRIAQLAPDRPKGARAPDTLVSSPPLQLLQTFEPSPAPLTTDERQLHSLERSLQTGQNDSAPRFLPAVTARYQLEGSADEARPFGEARPLGEGRPFGEAIVPVTLELGDADLEEMAPMLEELQELEEPGKAGEPEAPAGPRGRRRSRPDAVTEVRARREDRREGEHRTGSFHPAATVPDTMDAPGPVPEGKAVDTLVNVPVPPPAGDDDAPDRG